MFREDIYNIIDKVLTYSGYYGDNEDLMFAHAINEFIEQYDDEMEHGYIFVEDLIKQLSKFRNNAQIISCADPYLGIGWLMVRDGDMVNTILTQKW